MHTLSTISSISISNGFAILLSGSLGLSGCTLPPLTTPPTDAELEAVADVRKKKVALRKAEEAASGARGDLERAHEALTEVADAAASRRARKRKEREEYERYHASIAAAIALGRSCQGGKPPPDAVDQHRYLVTFVGTPERDAALSNLEACRRILVKAAEREIRGEIADLQSQFAREIEDAFDASNPYSRGGLVATVRGTKLEVRMRGNFEGRRRHSQEQVDQWCVDNPLFSMISLRNSHGTFTCTPESSPRDYEVARLTLRGLVPPWTPADPGEVALPAAPETEPGEPQLPPEESTRLALVDKVRDLESVLEVREEELIRHEEAVRQAQKRVTANDLKRADSEAMARREHQEAARKTHLAGVGLGGAGALLTLGGASLVYARGSTQTELDAARAQQGIFDSLGQASSQANTQIDELESKLAIQTTGLAVGLGVGIPLLATGIILFVLGKSRGQAAETKVTTRVAPGGVVLRF